MMNFDKKNSETAHSLCNPIFSEKLEVEEKAGLKWSTNPPGGKQTKPSILIIDFALIWNWKI